jgi:hypothetical protein
LAFALAGSAAFKPTAGAAIIIVPLKRAPPPGFSASGKAKPQLAQFAAFGPTAFPHSGQNDMLEITLGC